MSISNQSTPSTEKLLAQLFEVKNKHDFNQEHFLLLLGLVNLMKIINMLEGRVKGAQQGGGEGRSPAGPDLVPLMSMFGKPRVRPSSEK